MGPIGIDMELQLDYRYLPVKLFLINHQNNNQLTLYTDYNLLIYKSKESNVSPLY